MTKPKWLRKDVILAVHQKTLNEQGGFPGIRDEGLLESALARPVNITHYAPESNLHEHYSLLCCFPESSEDLFSSDVGSRV